MPELLRTISPQAADEILAGAGYRVSATLPDGQEPAGVLLTPTDWQSLVLEGVPEIPYLDPPYFPRLARTWIWGATGTAKSIFAAWKAAAWSRSGLSVSYFSEENPLNEELRRLSLVSPDPGRFRLFHRTGMDLQDPGWIAAMLSVTGGDDAVVFDSWTDLWSGDEGDNRAVQQFDSSVLKPLQAAGTTPIVLHHTGHKYMFSDRKGATAGRGASSLGQKADVTLEFRTAGEQSFTVVFGKSRIGGAHEPDRTFRIVDVDGGGLDIVQAPSPQEQAVAAMLEKMVQAIQTAPRGLLTTSELRAAVGGSREHQKDALAQLETDPRATRGVEKTKTKDDKLRDAMVWRPARGGLS